MLDGGGERKHVVLKHGGEHSKEAREVRGVAVEYQVGSCEARLKDPKASNGVDAA